MGDLVPFQGGAMPAVFAGRQSGMLAAAKAGVQASFAVIGYKGKNWRVKYRGDEVIIKGADGFPMPYIDVVIVGVSPAISKQFYEKKFTEGSDEAPDCFSVDGISPDTSSPKKQCNTCAVCPKNAWGSRITDEGKKGKACQDSRRIAIVPMGDDLENEVFGGPMMLRLPPMSLGNFASYADMLQKRGADFPFVATRLSFDPAVAYPRIAFQAIGWLNEQQAFQVVGRDGQSGICANSVIERMLAEQVEAATHDAAEPAAEADPLASGGPAAVFASGAVGKSPVLAAPYTPEAPPPTPAPAPSPAPSPVATPSPAAGLAGAFGGSAPAPLAVSPAPAAPATSTAAQPGGTAPASSAPAAVIQGAPASMEAAIDELLAMPATA